VGLDTDPSQLPESICRSAAGVTAFNSAIIRATSDIVCAYKPNAAFYEAMGSSGIDSLSRIRAMIPGDIPLILDVKRGDIGNTADRYAAFAYDVIGDAVTVNPYMGFDAVKPFMRPGKGVFILCLTSNHSSSDFQMLESDGEPLFLRVARAAASWAGEGEIGLVVGATKPEHMKRIREVAGNVPILVPGVGAQGGDVEAVIANCGKNPGETVINSSRSIIYASPGEDFASAARSACLSLRDEINRARRDGK
jgi:orotidine-5'-phosphate decarboxylase